MALPPHPVRTHPCKKMRTVAKRLSAQPKACPGRRSSAAVDDRSRTRTCFWFSRPSPTTKVWVPHPGCLPERPERSDGSRRTRFLELWRTVGYHDPPSRAKNCSLFPVPCSLFPEFSSRAQRATFHAARQPVSCRHERNAFQRSRKPALSYDRPPRRTIVVEQGPASARDGAKAPPIPSLPPRTQRFRAPRSHPTTQMMDKDEGFHDGAAVFSRSSPL